MTSRIASVRGRQIWDSRGRPTVEAELRLENGALGRAAAPAGASRGIHEAIDLRDGGERFAGQGVERAVAHVNGEIAGAIIGLDSREQAKLDRILEELDGTRNFARLGANAAVAVSLAAAHAAAAHERLPLWRYLANGGGTRLPLPEIQIFGGGAHAGRRTDIQDFMIMAPGAGNLRRAFEIAAGVYHAAGRLLDDAGLLAGVADEGGWWPNFSSNEQALVMLTRAIESARYRPGDDVFISLDIAASEFHRDGRYRLGLDAKEMDANGLIGTISGWCRTYPILSIEDPVTQDDATGMQAATRELSNGAQIVGDDFLVTDAARVREAVGTGACTAALIKVNQAGTMTRARAALDAARVAGWSTIVSARSGETEDLSIAHLAVGWDAGQIKVGSFARSERMAKWNELLRIEEEMGADAAFAGWGALPQRVRR